VALDAEMTDAKVLAPRGGQRRLADRLVHAAAAQVARGADRPQRDVHGKSRVQERPRLVRRAGPRTLRRSTRAGPLCTPLGAEHQLILHTAVLAALHTG